MNHTEMIEMPEKLEKVDIALDNCRQECALMSTALVEGLDHVGSNATKEQLDRSAAIGYSIARWLETWSKEFEGFAEIVRSVRDLFLYPEDGEDLSMRAVCQFFEGFSVEDRMRALAVLEATEHKEEAGEFLWRRDRT